MKTGLGAGGVAQGRGLANLPKALCSSTKTKSTLGKTAKDDFTKS
jgi:hypothetical protein